MDGFLLINKDKGWTSRDVCNRLSHILHTKKIGHNGTLDPFAEGLMIVGVNKSTKALIYANFEYKTYIAKLKLGIQTDTGDLTGEVIKEIKAPTFSKEKIIEVFHSFIGKSKQLIPMTSAVHVNGKKLYQYLHEGIEVDRPTREVEIKYIELLDYQDDVITFKSLVSSGTYIRVLGEDIANKLNTCGHLISLIRTSFGEKEEITLDKAIKIEEVDESKLLNPIPFINLPHVYIDEVMTFKAKAGQKLSFDNKEDKILLIHQEQPIAIYVRINKKIFAPERGLW